MKVCILLSVITLAAALTPSEVNVIKNYGNWYGYGGDCYTLNVNEDGDEYTVESNGLPNHAVYVSNRNDVIESAYNYRIPKTPVIAAHPSCVGMGEIGFALNGVPFFNPLAGNGANAVQGSGSETFDGCGGHPAPMGHYHYHMLPGLDCIFHDNIIPDNGNGTLMGVALDGFPIYYWEEATKVAGFEELLDECHGTSMLGDTYRYYITDKYPYIIGCFKGTPARTTEQCPDFQGAKNVLCSCANSGGPSGGAPPMGGDGQMRPPFMQRRQTAAGTELLTFHNTTDSECIQAFACEVELNRHLWCHSNAARPRQCDNQQGPICSGLGNAQQAGQQMPPQQMPGMQDQYGQQMPPQQMPGMQDQYGQQMPPQQMPGMQDQYGQQMPPQQMPGMQDQYGQQMPPQQMPGMQDQYGQQMPPQQMPGMQDQYGQQQGPPQQMPGMQGQYGQQQGPSQQMPGMQGMQGQYGQQQGPSQQRPEMQGMQGQYGQQQGTSQQMPGMQGMQGQYGQQQGPPQQMPGMQGMQGQYGQQQGPPQQMPGIQGMQGHYGQQQGPPHQMQGQYGQHQGPPQQMQGMQGQYGQQQGPPQQMQGQYGQHQGPPQQMQGMQGQYGQQQGPPQQMQGQYGQHQGPPQQIQGMQGQYGQHQGPPQQMQGMQGQYGQQQGPGRFSMGRPQKRNEALIALLKRMLRSKRK